MGLLRRNKILLNCWCTKPWAEYTRESITNQQNKDVPVLHGQVQTGLRVPFVKLYVIGTSAEETFYRAHDRTSTYAIVELSCSPDMFP